MKASTTAQEKKGRASDGLRAPRRGHGAARGQGSSHIQYSKRFTLLLLHHRIGSCPAQVGRYPGRVRQDYPTEINYA